MRDIKPMESGWPTWSHEGGGAVRKEETKEIQSNAEICEPERGVAFP